MNDPNWVRPRYLPVVQPEPPRRAGPLALVATALTGALVVVVVLYGVAQPSRNVTASAPPGAENPAASASGQAANPPLQANAPAGNGQAPAQPRPKP